MTLMLPSNQAKLSSAIALLAALCTAGCSSVATVTPVADVTSSKIAFQGNVHGGQQPVIGAKIQLYAAGTPTSGGAYGTGSTALITGTLPVTDLNGNFTITGDYTLPTTPSHLYIVATGGSPGVGLPINSDIALMAVLDNCTASSTLSTSLFININEVTTMASVFALQPFLAAPASANSAAPNIGAPSTAYAALQNGFETTNNLANFQTGQVVPALSNYATSTTNGQLVNSLADSLAYCINSNPLLSNNCSTLFADVKPTPSVFTPTDTIQAAFYIAQNPTYNVNAIYNLGSGTPPFIGLGSAPTSFAYTVATSASACQAPIPLGAANPYAVLAGQSITNASTASDQTVITGGLYGVSPGTSTTGFVTGTYTATLDNTDAAAAEGALTTAYNSAAGLALPAVLPADMSGITFTPGVYKTSSSVTLNSGAVTLDAQGDPNAAFVFQIGTTLIAAGGTQVILINGAQSSNIYWQVGSSATMNNATAWVGNILAYTTITFGTDATLHGRAMASGGSVTLQSNKITIP
jgi:hypothetical protein